MHSFPRDHPPHPQTAPCVVKPPHEGPEVLDESGERLTQSRENDEAEGDTEESVEHSRYASVRCGRYNVTISYNQPKNSGVYNVFYQPSCRY